MPSIAQATSMTAGVIMEKMSSAERFSFVAGIVEGLAQSRYMQDGKKPDGMKCIYDWFYENKDNVETVYAAFKRYPDYPPGTIVDLMVRKACPV